MHVFNFITSFIRVHIITPTTFVGAGSAKITLKMLATNHRFMAAYTIAGCQLVRPSDGKFIATLGALMSIQHRM